MASISSGQGMEALHGIREKAFAMHLRSVSVQSLKKEAEDRFRRLLTPDTADGTDVPVTETDPLLLLVRNELIRRGRVAVWDTACHRAAYGDIVLRNSNSV